MKLPIDDLLPELEEHPLCILTAEPGAGKTTRVPPWLAKSRSGRVVLIQPRRVAAIHAAHRIAEDQNWTLGVEVGYRVKGESNCGNDAQVEVLTDGRFLRRLLKDPEAQGIGTVVLDEFHERRWQGDAILALLLSIREHWRSDLKLVVMSATLDVEALNRHLDGAKILTSPGRLFPVDVHYQRESPPRPDLEMVGKTILQALRDHPEGDVLVFLPGRGEIQTLLRDLKTDAEVLPLHGGLELSAQKNVLRSSSKRRVILSTDLAETSLTVPGVQVVIDVGFCRRPVVEGGITRMILQRISRHSAEQRSGRAGRLGPGHTYRLWGKMVQQGLLPTLTPEVERCDLSEPCLELASWLEDPTELPWLTPPPAPAWNLALEQCRGWGFLNSKGDRTERGERAHALPLPPRIGSMVLSSEHPEQLPALLFLATLVQNPKRGEGIPDDLSIALASPHRLLKHNRWLEREWKDLCRDARCPPQLPQNSAVESTLWVSFADRLCGVRTKDAQKALCSDGSGVRLSEHQATRTGEWFFALKLSKGGGPDAHVTTFWPLDPQNVQEHFSTLPWKARVEYCERDQKLEKLEEKRWGQLVVETRPLAQPPREELERGLSHAIDRLGDGALNFTPQCSQFLLRCDRSPSVSNLGLNQWKENRQAWLQPHLAGLREVKDLKSIDLQQVFAGLLEWEETQALEREAPLRWELPSGKSVPLRYEGDGTVVASGILQWFLGCQSTLKVADRAVTLELLSPARRPIQVTKDLEGFWKGSYALVRKEYRGRYPKHRWPEDPLELS